MAAERTPRKTTRSTRKKGTGGGGGTPGGGDGGGGGDGYDGEPIGEEPENVDVHEAYLRYRLEGGERPSTQAYARAFEQFRKLPGAIRGKPAFVPPKPPDDDGDPDGYDDKPDDEGDRQ